MSIWDLIFQYSFSEIVMNFPVLFLAIFIYNILMI
jgi:hypothetical protein